MPVMAKRDGPRRLIGPHGIKSQNHLVSALRPLAMLNHVPFADEYCAENRAAVRSQIEGKDTLRRIRRRRTAFVGTWHLLLRT